jgi:flagellar M-ring protein FliF
MATATQLEKSAAPLPGLPQWTDRLSGLLSLAQVRWATMPPAQRRWTLAVAVLLLGLIGGLFWYGLRTDWRTLYADLDPEDARQTAQILSQAQIPFDTTANGTGIRVPADLLDKARLTTAGKGSVKSGRMGFEIFDKPNWVGSEFDEQVNYQRALEGELEHTVGSLNDIKSARVHLVMPHDSLFRDQERPAKASVVIKLRHRSLADGEADAIRNLVASAVDGLTPDRVVLVDAAGNLPLGPKTADALRLTAEEALEEKLVSTLEPVTGVGNVRASVTLDYDASATEETQETYDPDQTVTLSMQRTEQSAGPLPIAAGIPGTASNAPNSQALPVYPQQTTSPQTAKTESGTYGASKTTRHVQENPGRVRRMTAAIVVNDRLTQPASKGKASAWQPRSAEELRNLTALAQAAVGFDTARGDMLTVQDLTFDVNRSAQPVSLPGQVLATVENSPVLVKYAALMAGVIVVVAFGVRPALRRSQLVVAKGPQVAPTDADKDHARQLPVANAELGTPVVKVLESAWVDPEIIRAKEILEQVSEHLKTEPTQSSRMLQSWIHSE